MSSRQLLFVVLHVFVSLCVSVAVAGKPIVLFDGSSLEGFDVIGCQAKIVDGAIKLESGNGLIQTKKQYTNFVLSYEWKALGEKMWDSGLYFRYQEVPAGRPWPKDFQINLRKGMEGDIGGFKDGKNLVPTKQGDWNKFELTVKGSKASLRVNDEPSWEVDGIAEPKGWIAIQAEVPGGGQFLFRNIQIKELD
jgi:hypothetical protein